MAKKELDINTLESWLWEAACKIRGEIDAAKYKDYILPLIFLKRLSDVFDDEIQKLTKEFGNLDMAEELLKEDHSLVRFYLPKRTRWPEIAIQAANIGEYLTDSVRSIARENPKLAGVIDMVDFNASNSGQRIISEGKLKLLIQVMGRYRLGINDVESDLIGNAYEYLLRKFAEGSGQSAGEFYTPREVAVLMSHILNPEPGDRIYDPCAGSGGLLIKCHTRFNEKYKNDNKVAMPHYYGQEILHSTFAMAKMNIFIHDMTAEIKLGDTMTHPAFLTEQGSLDKFDLVTANPMWNQDFTENTYINDPYERFSYGYPPQNTADWGWIQHMYSSLKDKGKLAIVLDTGAVSRGSGNAGRNRERDIRKQFIENDHVEAVILLPENLFYNTTSPGIILILNKNKTHKDEILLINSSQLFEKGRPKNYLTDESIKTASNVYYAWEEKAGISRIVGKEEIAKNDYNLSPSRYVLQDGKDDTLTLEDAVVLLKEAEEEREKADDQLNKVLEQLGLQK